MAVPPAGSTPCAGMDLGECAMASFAVVSFEIDGNAPNQQMLV